MSEEPKHDPEKSDREVAEEFKRSLGVIRTREEAEEIARQEAKSQAN